MTDNKRAKTVAPNEERSRSTNERKPYERPALRELGDVRGITLGGSPGAGESGFTTLFKP